jgi:hypothetical protein
MKSGFGLMLWLLLGLGGCCIGRHSAVEGRLVDGAGNPVANVKIAASQVHPIKGYERSEAVTKSDGTFRLRRLLPSSVYVLKPVSGEWTCETTAQVKSAPRGLTAIMPSPLLLRFTVSPEGVITDALTSLEWIVGPDRDLNYDEATRWVAECEVAGGGWRMPTRQELAELYLGDSGRANLDPAFRMTGWWVWSEPQDASSAWHFRFNNGTEDSLRRHLSSISRGFGVRQSAR